MIAIPNSTRPLLYRPLYIFPSPTTRKDNTMATILFFLFFFSVVIRTRPLYLSYLLFMIIICIYIII